MKGFGFSTILVGSVLILLLVCAILMAYVMYSMSNAPKKASGTTVNDDGVSAEDFWTSNKMMMIIPSVGNVLGMVLLSLFYIMG